MFTYDCERARERAHTHSYTLTHTRILAHTQVSRQFVGREAELNDALRRKYKSDLKTMAAQQQAAEAAQRERDADAGVCVCVFMQTVSAHLCACM